MPTKKVVDRFVQMVSVAAAQVSAGATQSVTLSGTSGLDSTGNNFLDVFRPRAGQAPLYVETLYGWSGISGSQLTSAVRATGAALQAGDIVVCTFSERLWDSLDDEIEPGAFDVVVSTAAELAAALVTGNQGKSIWVKGGTYTHTSSHLRIWSGMHITWGGGGTGPVTLDFGDTLYWLLDHEDFRYVTLNGTSGATATTTGSVVYDADVAGASAVLPNEAGWRVAVNGLVGSYTYASPSSFTMGNYPLSDLVNTSNGYHALITKGAAENVVMTGDLIIKGTSGTGVGTRALNAKIMGHNWNCSGLKLTVKKRGYRPHFWSSNILLFGSNIRWGQIVIEADQSFTNTSNDFSGSSSQLQWYGQHCTIDDLCIRNICLIDTAAYGKLLRAFYDGGSHNVIKNYHTSGFQITGSGGALGYANFVSITARVGCKILGGSGSAWRRPDGTAMTASGDAWALTGGFSTANGCSIGSWTYTP